MDIIAVEKKWNKIWEEKGIYKFNEKNIDKKFYLLEMFSYPSGLNLHLGHWWNFGLSDSYGRFKRMQGYEVFQPMGFDAFGLPAENYALKTGIHPQDSTKKNIAAMEKQLKGIGATFDWDYEIKTCEPEYYKWTQWIFTKLFEKGLAYQKYAPVNWCPSCNTVLANEQVVDGLCERCGSEVVHKNMTQWFLKITDYAERLLTGLDTLDWPEKTKILQKNWIGKSVGGEVDFKTVDGKHTLTVFTTRADTLFGVSYVVIAPEHPLVKEITTPKQAHLVQKYCENAAKMDDITRTSTSGEKTGVFTGCFCINPINNQKVPVYVGDYVLATYATGVVMGVAAHDSRDYAFAKKNNLKIVRVIESCDGKDTQLPYTNYGKLVNSGEFDGLKSEDAKIKIIEKLEKLGLGRKKVNYKLRDWSVSRQRYWGCPIPIIYCKEHGAVAVPEKDLPVLLPHITDYKPQGNGPLGKVEQYMNTVCPICGKPARRDPDTLDTFMCSTWYQFRYFSNKCNDVIFDKEKTNKMLPVDKYVGGIEHATSHLLYSRFITKFLHDIGCIDFDEPFLSLVHQGMILGKDGKKMSKRNGGKTADEYVAEYGSDALRLHMMFAFKYTEGGPWQDDGLKHMKAFMDRIERIVLKWNQEKGNSKNYGKAEQELEYVKNNTIKEYTSSFEVFGFNSAIARIMELVNAMYKYDAEKEKNGEIMRSCIKDLVKLISPCAPHFAEELWQMIGEEFSVTNQRLPQVDESKIKRESVQIALQINSKIVARIDVESNLSTQQIETAAKQSPLLQKALQGKKIVKTIVVPNRIVNFIVQ